MAEATSANPAAGRHQRSFRNYLLDPHFQLKYSGYLVGIAALLSISLGVILWRTSQAVIAQSHEAVAVGEQVVVRGRELLEESQKVSAVVRMNIVEDPVYKDNEALLKAFQADAAKQDAHLLAQQERLEEQSQRLKEQTLKLRNQQRAIGTTLIVLLALLVVGVGLVGIVVTHKVAGPIFKMKRQIRALGDGHLSIPAPLRKGDELVDFFEAFRNAVIELRARQEREIAMLDRAIENLQDREPETYLEELRELRAEMQAGLDK